MEPNITFPYEYVNLAPLLENDVWRQETIAIDKYIKDLGQDSKVLDLASGPGFCTDYVARKFGCDVLGVDILPEMVASATERYGSNRVSFLQGDMCNPDLLPNSERSFSLVMCHHGLHHVTDAQSFLRNCHRLTKDNGYLLNTCFTRQYGDGEIVSALKETLQDTKWQSYAEKVEIANKTPMFSLMPEKYPWILDTRLLFDLIESSGFSIVQKEIRKHDVIVSFSKSFVESVLFCVKSLPVDQQDEFLDDIVQAGRTLSGDEEPVVKFSTVVVFAQKKESP